MSYVTNLKPEQVDTPEKLARFCQEQTGIPYPTGAQIATLKKAIKDFFATYPNATYTSLTNVVLWSKAKNRRYAHVANLINGGLRYAYLEGWVPELDPNHNTRNIGELLTEAVNQESDPVWKMKLINNWNTEVYDAWVAHRKEQS